MTDDAYDRQARAELAAWRKQVLKGPGLLGKAARGVQGKINAIIPEKVHQAVTATIEQMTRAILTGSDWTTADPLIGAGLAEREARVKEKIALYRTTAAAEGGIAGAGGFLLAAADFPALMAIKVKMLFEIAALYGHSGRTPRERLFILRIFQLAFSSARHRPEALALLEAEADPREPGVDLEDFDWRRFQLEYRDYIDVAKLAQLLPIVGAPVGAVVNWRLTDRLATTAMNAYRLRHFQREDTA